MSEPPASASYGELAALVVEQAAQLIKQAAQLAEQAVLIEALRVELEALRRQAGRDTAPSAIRVMPEGSTTRHAAFPRQATPLTRSAAYAGRSAGRSPLYRHDRSGELWVP